MTGARTFEDAERARADRKAWHDAEFARQEREMAHRSREREIERFFRDVETMGPTAALAKLTMDLRAQAEQRAAEARARFVRSGGPT